MSLGVSAAYEDTNPDIPRRRLQLSAGASIEGSRDRGMPGIVRRAIALRSNHFLRFSCVFELSCGGKKRRSERKKKQKKGGLSK